MHSLTRMSETPEGGMNNGRGVVVDRGVRVRYTGRALLSPLF